MKYVETAVVEGDPSNGPHYDGALDADTWVAISGYGPTKATVVDGGDLFGRSR